MARENHVTVVSLPPHCTHRLQPLDVSFMGPLKSYYSKAIEKFHRYTKGQPVKQANISTLFAEAYGKAAQPATAENGFRRTGLYPLDRGVFTDEDFAHSDLSTPAASDQIIKTKSRSRNDSIDLEEDFIGFGEAMIYHSKESGHVRASSVLSSRTSVANIKVFPNDIMPLPRHTIQSSLKRGRAAEKAAVLTSDNFIHELRLKKIKKEKENHNENNVIKSKKGARKKRV